MHILNPKSLTVAELYGSFDAISHEFSDGVLGRIFRESASTTRTASRQWIIFDGPVDAEWIENMNTALDDNKKLCLLSGEIILMSSNMNLLFEADSLSQASPATVSRCGMIYFEPAMIGVESHLESWLATLAPKLCSPTDGSPVSPVVHERISDLFDTIFRKCSKFVTSKCTTYVACSEVQLARSLMAILATQLAGPSFIGLCHDPHIRPAEILFRLDMHFLYALVWSVGAVSDEAGQRAFSQYLRAAASTGHQAQSKRAVKLDRGCMIPDGGQLVHEYFVDEHRWASWNEKLLRVQTQESRRTAVEQIVVPTTESLKIEGLLDICLANRMPLLLVGPTGTGKTLSVLGALRAAPREVRSTIQITFSARSSTRQTSEILLSKLEKRGRRAVGPPPGKRATLFVDDLNMPSLEKYGAQPPVELLRQLMDHRGWYD
jgi:dynein heavy chain